MRLHSCLAASAVVTFALITPTWAQDADGDGVADTQDALPCDPQVSAVTFSPAEDVHGMLVFEDMWPLKGDNDFNDVVLTYNYVHKANAAGVVSVHGTFDLLALGGLYDHSLGLHLPIPTSAVQQVRRRIDGGAWQLLNPSLADTELTVTMEPFLRNLFGGLEGQLNTLPTQARLPAVRIELEVTLSQPTVMDTAEAPYDVFIARAEDPGHEIHRTMYAGTAAMNPALFNTGHDGSSASRHFVDTSRLPFVLELPESTPYPAEAVRISSLFPSIVQFGYSAGTLAQDFYLFPVASEAYVDLNGLGVPAPAPIAPEVVDESCLADPIPLYSTATWGGGCKWGFNGNASWYGAKAASFSGAGIPGSRFVQFDFGVPTPVSGLAANAYSSSYRKGGWKGFRVLYLNSAGTWTTAYSGTHPNASGTKLFSFPMQTARYWRFYMDSVYMTFSTSCGYGQFQGTVQLRNP